MTDTPLLGDLCTICHSPPKYRCPRCSARTCSLVCSKRHKQWAQCSGMRDPAAYLKRSELATPKSFDQDFNFISGIERTIERADRDATSRGVQLRGDHKAGRRDGPAKGELQLQRARERCGVIIEKAPVGMSRNTNNKTSWNKNQQCISWTVEWVLDDGRRELGTCLEKDALSEAFRKQYEPSLPRSKRRKTKHGKRVAETVATRTYPVEGLEGDLSPNAEQFPPSVVPVQQKKLPPDLEGTKLDTIQSDVLESTYPENTPPDAVNKEVTNPEPAQPELITPAVTFPASKKVDGSNCETKDPEPTDVGVTNPPPATSDPTCEQPDQIHQIEDAINQPSAPPASALHFYLHLPHPAVPSSKPTLLPLPATSTLTTALRNRVVREYPTIYVLRNQAEDSPSERFTLQIDIDAGLEEAMNGMLDGEADGKLGDGKKDDGVVGEVDGSTEDVEMDIPFGESPNQVAQSQLDDLSYIQHSFI